MARLPLAFSQATTGGTILEPKTPTAFTSTEDLHLEGPLHVGFASFAYYVKANGYNLSRSGKNHLTLSREGVYFCFELILDDPHVECGYVYVNSYDWGGIFGENLNKDENLYMARCLSEKCWRRKGRLFFVGEDWHCHIDNSLKGNIKVVFDSGQEVICKYIR